MNRKNFTTRFALLAAATLALSGAALAQAGPMEAGESVAVFPPPNVAMQMKVSTMGLHIDNMAASSVKGNPFCGTIVSEHTQVFADGNRIHTTENSMLCRDSQGRIRRESELNLLGALPQKSSPKMVTIVDPVAGVRYMLDSNLKIARKMPMEPFALPDDGRAKAPGQMAYVIKRETQEGGVAAGNVMFYSAGATMAKPAGDAQNPPNVDNLGDQTINGVHAVGTRVTTTIPAGSMGNEQPIIVQSETWSSPELKAMVMTKHTDPWAGELKTQLTNVNNSEPDPTLFTIPSDYRVVDEKPFQIKLPPPPPPSQE